MPFNNLYYIHIVPLTHSEVFSAINAILKVKISFLVLIDKNTSLSPPHYLDTQSVLLLEQVV